MEEENNKMETNSVDEKVDSSHCSTNTGTNPCRRSRSSKSTRSGSNSSGYGGQPSTHASSNNSVIDSEIKKIKKRDHKKNTQITIKSIMNETEMELDVTNKENTLPEEQVNDEVCKENVAPVLSPLTPVKANIEVDFEKNNLKDEDGFSCVISMHDGVVLYTTTSLSSILEFPKDMWVGRSFMNFLHPKDCHLFTTHILGFISPKMINGMNKKVQNQSNILTTIFCRIRKYRGLKNCGFAIKDQEVIYLPFLLKFSLKNVSVDNGSTVYLVIQANQCITAYKAPNEVISKAVPFVIRHGANGKCEYLDPQAVSYLGYLPQDVKEQCVLQLYHPDDLYNLSNIYRTIIKEGVAPRSKSFKMMTQNGDYVKLETEWSSFINPWSRKLEFVIGKHYVVEGPANIEIFKPTELDKIVALSEEDKIKRQFLKQNLVKIMNELLTKPAVVAKQRLSKRCRDLTFFVKKLMEDPTNNQIKEDVEDIDSLQDRDDAGLSRRISPAPRINNDSDTDTNSTQFSYGRLNTTDILKRYFDSHRPYFNELMHTSFDPDHISSGTMSSTPEEIIDLTNEFDDDESIERGSSPLQQLDNESLERILNPMPQVLTESALERHNTEMHNMLLAGFELLKEPMKEVPVPQKPCMEIYKPQGLKRSSEYPDEGPSPIKYLRPTTLLNEFEEQQPDQATNKYSNNLKEFDEQQADQATPIANTNLTEFDEQQADQVTAIANTNLTEFDEQQADEATAIENTNLSEYYSEVASPTTVIARSQEFTTQTPETSAAYKNNFPSYDVQDYQQASTSTQQPLADSNNQNNVQNYTQNQSGLNNTANTNNAYPYFESMFCNDPNCGFLECRTNTRQNIYNNRPYINATQGNDESTNNNDGLRDTDSQNSNWLQIAEHELFLSILYNNSAIPRNVAYIISRTNQERNNNRMRETNNSQNALNTGTNQQPQGHNSVAQNINTEPTNDQSNYIYNSNNIINFAIIQYDIESVRQALTKAQSSSLMPRSLYKKTTKTVLMSSPENTLLQSENRNLFKMCLEYNNTMSKLMQQFFKTHRDTLPHNDSLKALMNTQTDNIEDGVPVKNNCTSDNTKAIVQDITNPTINGASPGKNDENLLANDTHATAAPGNYDKKSRSSDMLYNYKINSRNTDEVLKQDRQHMNQIKQSSLVDEQLAQLYNDMKLIGRSNRLYLEETDSSEDEGGPANED